MPRRPRARARSPLAPPPLASSPPAPEPPDATPRSVGAAGVPVRLTVYLTRAQVRAGWRSRLDLLASVRAALFELQGDDGGAYRPRVVFEEERTPGVVRGLAPEPPGPEVYSDFGYPPWEKEGISYAEWYSRRHAESQGPPGDQIGNALDWANPDQAVVADPKYLESLDPTPDDVHPLVRDIATGMGNDDRLMEKALDLEESLDAGLAEAEYYAALDERDRERERAREHLLHWAPGNLQHHLITDHGIAPHLVPYDGALDEVHSAAHKLEGA